MTTDEQTLLDDAADQLRTYRTGNAASTRQRLGVKLCPNKLAGRHQPGRSLTCGTCARARARAEYSQRTGLAPETMCRNYKYQHEEGTSDSCRSCQWVNRHPEMKGTS